MAKLPRALLPPPSPDRPIGRTSEGRVIIRNRDGSVSTERTVTFGDDEQGYINVPTMFGGQQYDPREALGIILRNLNFDPDTGRYIKTHKTLKDAEDEARARTRSLGEELRRIIEGP